MGEGRGSAGIYRLECAGARRSVFISCSRDGWLRATRQDLLASDNMHSGRFFPLLSAPVQ